MYIYYMPSLLNKYAKYEHKLQGRDRLFYFEQSVMGDISSP